MFNNLKDMGNIQFLQVTPKELADLINEGLKNHVENLIYKLSEQKESGKEFLSRKETAEFFGVSLVTIHSWINEGFITPYKMAGRTYFKRSELIQSLTKEGRVA